MQSDDPHNSTLSVQQCKYFLDVLCIPSLTEEDRNICEGLLTPGEVLNALKSMSKDKSPGNNGSRENFTFNSLTLSKIFLFSQSATLTKYENCHHLKNKR